MNYNYHYSLLVSRARNRILEGVVERHHVIPKCLGGIDDLSNIVALTPEEHFLAHQLLCKMHPNEPKLVFAMHMMTANKYGHRNNNKMYGWIRKKCVAEQKKPRPHRRKRQDVVENVPKKRGRPAGYKLSPESRAKIAEANRRRTGWKQSDAFKQLIVESNKRRLGEKRNKSISYPDEP